MVAVGRALKICPSLTPDSKPFLDLEELFMLLVERNAVEVSKIR